MQLATTSRSLKIMRSVAESYGLCVLANKERELGRESADSERERLGEGEGGR
jgi:hypothetical protein